MIRTSVTTASAVPSTPSVFPHPHYCQPPRVSLPPPHATVTASHARGMNLFMNTKAWLTYQGSSLSVRPTANPPCNHEDQCSQSFGNRSGRLIIGEHTKIYQEQCCDPCSADQHPGNKFCTSIFQNPKNVKRGREEQA